ncbi:uncharacterized protein LOC106876315 [Octopus bimaculoides]|nr:uncharacterized protein LOC106876315 [Octopus bimaculoides]
MAFCLMLQALLLNQPTGLWGILPPPSRNDIWADRNNVKYLESIEEVRSKAHFSTAYITYGGEIHWHDVPPPRLEVLASSQVSKLAHKKAAITVSKMVQYMPKEIFESITKSKGVGVFAKSEGPTIYPEFKRFADLPECKGKCDGLCQITCTHDGRKYERVAGLTLSRSVCLDHVVLCDDQDPYRSHENCLSHELGHLIMSYIPKSWTKKIYEAYQYAKKNSIWELKAYAMSNAQEYWAEGTGAFFRSNLLTYAAGKMNMCNQTALCSTEMDARDNLRRRDEKLFEILSYVYTDNRPELKSGMKTCM